MEKRGAETSHDHQEVKIMKAAMDTKDVEIQELKSEIDEKYVEIETIKIKMDEKDAKIAQLTREIQRMKLMEEEVKIVCLAFGTI